MPHVTIIAEAGINHNKDLAMAKEMIVRAHEAGADIVKFQTAVLELVMTDQAQMAEYAVTNVGTVGSQIDMARTFTLELEAFGELKAFAERTGIEFLSSPFDLVSIRTLHEIGMRRWKIPSGEITNYPYLRLVGSYREPVILSTGMSCLGDVEAAIDVLTEFGTPREAITLLQCNTDYPTLFEDVNLKGMIAMRDAFHLEVGYSDHTPGIEASLAAVALGARIIEKHFTLDRDLPGPDHKASLEPDELKALVRGTRNIEKALGDGLKRPNAREARNRRIARKVVVAARDIPAGERFSEENLTTKRAGDGLSPMRWVELLGREAPAAFQKDELIWI